MWSQGVFPLPRCCPWASGHLLIDIQISLQLLRDDFFTNKVLLSEYFQAAL